jgi:RNA polymerase sigma-70 factor (ECF subfamily)
VADIPVGTVMSRLYRGRRVLERKLYDLAVERGIVKGRPDENDRVVELRAYKRRKDG